MMVFKYADTEVARRITVSGGCDRRHDAKV